MEAAFCATPAGAHMNSVLPRMKFRHFLSGDQRGLAIFLDGWGPALGQVVPTALCLSFALSAAESQYFYWVRHVLALEVEVGPFIHFIFS